jgi:hypothetical protein
VKKENTRNQKENFALPHSKPLVQPRGHKTRKRKNREKKARRDERELT